LTLVQQGKNDVVGTATVLDGGDPRGRPARVACAEQSGHFDIAEREDIPILQHALGRNRREVECWLRPKEGSVFPPDLSCSKSRSITAAEPPESCTKWAKVPA